MDDTDELINTRQVMNLLKISQATVDRWEKSGRLSAMRLPNGYRRWRLSDVLALLDDAQSRVR